MMARKKGKATKRAKKVVKRPAARKAKQPTRKAKPGKKAVKRPAKSIKKTPKGELIMFHGRECPHCRDMDPLVNHLEKELKVVVKKLEVWHDPVNAAKLQKIDIGLCGGVPFFWNSKSKKYICGAVDYRTLKDWAKGK